MKTFTVVGIGTVLLLVLAVIAISLEDQYRDVQGICRNFIGFLECARSGTINDCELVISELALLRRDLGRYPFIGQAAELDAVIEDAMSLFGTAKEISPPGRQEMISACSVMLIDEAREIFE